MRRRQKDESWAYNLLADFLAIVCAYYTGMMIRFQSAWGDQFFTGVNRFLRVRETADVGDGFGVFYLASAPRIVLILTVTLCTLYALRDLYAGWRFVGRRPLTWNVVVANTLALGIFYAYFYLSRNVFHPRSFFATVIVLNVLFCVAFRSIVGDLAEFVRSKFTRMRCRALLVGRDKAASMIEDYIDTIHPHGIEIVDRIVETSGQPFDDLLADIIRAARERGADMLITAEESFSVAEIMRLLEVADGLDIPVKVLSDKLDVLLHRARLPVDMIRGLPLVHFDAPSTSNRFERLRRYQSFVVALLGLVVTLPLMLVITILIAATSRGSVFFIQERIGVNRKPFRMIKFRTMKDRADEMQAEVEEFNESGPGLFKIRKDPRVTPVGRFLRRFSLDELPQLLNVIRGEMVIVGPRPLPRRDFENYYEEWHYSRHSGMPGLTCLWQVSGRSEIDFHNMCILDVYYLRNRSWVLDLKIVLRTALAVVFARGAY